MATTIMFTNNQTFLKAGSGLKVKVGKETFTTNEVRPARGDGALQIDALYYRKEDNAAVIAASIPRYMTYQGRLLNAYCTLVLEEFPESLKGLVSHYVGRTRTITRPDGSVVIGPNGRPQKGHVWDFPGYRLVTSLQLREGFALAIVDQPRLSTRQDETGQNSTNYTIDFKLLLSPNCTWGPWSRPVTRAVSDTVIEQQMEVVLPNGKLAEELPEF